MTIIIIPIIHTIEHLGDINLHIHIDKTLTTPIHNHIRHITTLLETAFLVVSPELLHAILTATAVDNMQAIHIHMKEDTIGQLDTLSTARLVSPEDW